MHFLKMHYAGIALSTATARVWGVTVQSAPGVVLYLLHVQLDSNLGQDS